MAKNFTLTTIGLAVEEVRLSVDDPVISFFPHELPTEIISNLAAMQVKHLLIGDDFRFGAGRQGDQAMLRAAGARYGFQVEAMDSQLVDGLRAAETQKGGA